MRESQSATLQLLSSSAGIQETTSKGLYANFQNLKSQARIAYQNTDEVQAGNTVIEACRWSEDGKYVSASNNNERLIKLDPNSTIQAQLDHVTNNHEQSKSTLPLSKSKNNRGNGTNILEKETDLWIYFCPRSRQMAIACAGVHDQTYPTKPFTGSIHLQICNMLALSIYYDD